EHDRGFVVSSAASLLVADDREARLVIRRVFDVGEEYAEAVADGGLATGDGGGAGFALSQFGGGRRARDFMETGVRDILTEPISALRERLRLGVNAADFCLLAISQQVVMNAKPDFSTNLELRQSHEHVQGVGHPSVGGVFQGHHTKISVAAIDFLEYRRDAA